MFAADARVLNRIKPTIQRVVIADPNQASARLLLDIMKSLGAREVVVESDEAHEAQRAFFEKRPPNFWPAPK